jgi:hypothetical protein
LCQSAAEVLLVATINWKAKGFFLGKAVIFPQSETSPTAVASVAACSADALLCLDDVSTEAFKAFADRV